jgi:SPP1 family predicted phage head-tail adaptor
MQIGRMRSRVQVQVQTEVPDQFGQNQPGWATTATRWGYVRTPTGRESLNAQQMQAALSHVVEMRYMAPLGPQQRLVLDGRIFNISHVIDPDGKHRQLIVYCEEVVTPSSP